MGDTQEIVLKRKWGRTNSTDGSILFVGTATTIIRYAGFTILTDPNFLHKGDHIHIGYGLRSTRLTNPALNLEDLPPLDLVVLSHMHEDHFDRLVQERLDHSLPIVTTPHAAEALSSLGFQSPCAIDKWETISFVKGDIRLRITAMPAQHGNAAFSKLLPAVMGSMLEFSNKNGNLLLRLYITGDTVMYKDLKTIPQRYPNIDIAMLHLGGGRVLGVLVTMDGAQGVEAVKLLQPQIVIPIHYNDYTVFKSPLEDFQQRIAAEGLEDSVRYLSHGETYRWRIPKTRV